MKTLSDILVDVNAYVDLNAALPTGDELITRINYANQAIWDAAAISQLSEFDRIYNTTSTASATIPLPSGFHEFKVSPMVGSNGNWIEYPEISPEDRYSKETGDKYCYVLGNPREGYFAIFNGLDSGQTVSFTYQAFPSGFATLTDICELDDPTYVSTKTESYVLQSRGSDKFPYVDAVSERKLKNLIGRGMKSAGGQYRVSPAGFKNPLR